MTGYTHEQWEKAESMVQKRAEEVAYMHSDRSSDRMIQKALYDMVKHYIMLGARMMEEELTKIEKDYDTKKTTD